MNHCLLDGIVAELGDTRLRAELEPQDGYCCVRFHPAPHAGREPSSRR